MLVRFEKCFIRFITCFNKSPMFLYAYSQIFLARTYEWQHKVEKRRELRKYNKSYMGEV